MHVAARDEGLIRLHFHRLLAGLSRLVGCNPSKNSLSPETETLEGGRKKKKILKRLSSRFRTVIKAGFHLGSTIVTSCPPHPTAPSLVKRVRILLYDVGWLVGVIREAQPRLT